MKPLIILVVDPHEGCRTALAKLLQAEGHDVIATDSWTTAGRLASECPFDVLVSELSLPDRSERDLLKTLHEQHGTVGILLTGFEEQLAGGWRRAGFTHYLYKPVGFQQVRSALASATAALLRADEVESEERELCWK